MNQTLRKKWIRYYWWSLFIFTVQFNNLSKRTEYPDTLKGAYYFQGNAGCGQFRGVDWAVVLTGSSAQSRDSWGSHWHDLPAVCLVSVFMQRHRVVTRCKLSSVNFSWRSYLTCQRAFVHYLSPFLMTHILAFLKFLLFYPSHIILSFVHRQECCSSWPTAERCSCWAPTQLQLSSQWCKTLVWLLWLQAR